MIVITMEHHGWVRRVPAVYVTEELLSLLYGSLLLGFVLSSLGKKPPGPVMFTPLWLYLGLLLVAPMFEMDSLKPPLGMENIMWVQIAYYLAAVAIYVHWRLHQPDRPLGPPCITMNCRMSFSSRNKLPKPSTPSQR